MRQAINNRYYDPHVQSVAGYLPSGSNGKWITNGNDGGSRSSVK